QVRGAGESGRARRSTAHHRARGRLSAGGIGGRVQAAVREGRPNGGRVVGSANPPASGSRLGNRAGGRFGVASLYREDRAALAGESAVRYVRPCLVPFGRAQRDRKS